MSTRRQRELRRIQSELERFYGLERAPNVTRFVRDGDQGSREVVLLRESADELEIALVLPPESKQIPAGGALSDVWLQVAEGSVIFFIWSSGRGSHCPSQSSNWSCKPRSTNSCSRSVSPASPASPTSAQTMPAAYSNGCSTARAFSIPKTAKRVHATGLAHHLAARFVSRVVVANDRGRALERLRAFYRAGQADKIRIASAA